MTGPALDDIETDALSAVVQSGIAAINQRRIDYGETAWADIIGRLARRGRELIDSGAVAYNLHRLSLDCHPEIGTGLGALAMQPGGLKLHGIVFCSTHCPAGQIEPYRMACRTCSPDLTTTTRDRRTVTPIPERII